MPERQTYSLTSTSVSGPTVADGYTIDSTQRLDLYTTPSSSCATAQTMPWFSLIARMRVEHASPLYDLEPEFSLVLPITSVQLRAPSPLTYTTRRELCPP